MSENIIHQTKEICGNPLCLQLSIALGALRSLGSLRELSAQIQLETGDFVYPEPNARWTILLSAKALSGSAPLQVSIFFLTVVWPTGF